MDFICFAARLKCYYEGGVGLQKTLNHAGPGAKRSSSLSRPGDSDSEDDEDEQEEDDDEEDGDTDGEETASSVGAGAAQEDLENTSVPTATTTSRNHNDAPENVGNTCDPTKTIGVGDHSDAPDDVDDAIKPAVTIAGGDAQNDARSIDGPAVTVASGFSDGKQEQTERNEPTAMVSNGYVNDDPMQNVSGEVGSDWDEPTTAVEECAVDGVGRNVLDESGDDNAEHTPQPVNAVSLDNEVANDEGESESEPSTTAAVAAVFSNGREENTTSSGNTNQTGGIEVELAEAADVDASPFDLGLKTPSPSASGTPADDFEFLPQDTLGLVSLASVSNAISAAVKAATSPLVVALDESPIVAKTPVRGNPFPTE